MVTSEPPERTSCAERSRISPPRTSNTTSTVAHVFQPVLLKVEERLYAVAEDRLLLCRATAADHPGSRLQRQLHGHRTDTARGAVNQDGLAAGEMSVVEQPLPRGQPGHRQRRGGDMVDVGRQRSEVTGFYRNVFRQGAVAGPVGEPEHRFADRQSSGAVTQLDDDAGHFVSRDGRCPVAPRPVGPGSWPIEFIGCERSRVHFDDDIVFRHVRVGHLGQRKTGDTGRAVMRDDRSHHTLCAFSVPRGQDALDARRCRRRCVG